jgi:hypothetical protein
MQLEHWKSEWVRHNVLGIVGMAASGVAATVLLRRKRIDLLPGGRAVLACAGVGIVYVLVLAPATRYMFGVLPIAVALFFAWAATRSGIAARAQLGRRHQLLRHIPSALVTLAACGFVVVWSQRFNPRTAFAARDARRVVIFDDFPLIAPPLFPTPDLYERKWNDIAYVSPVDTTRVPGHQLRNYTGMFDENVVEIRCGAAPPPCTPYFAYDDVILRDARRGIAGGFARRAPGAPGHAYIGLRTDRLRDGQPTSQR